MENFMSLPIDFALVQDVVLLLISGLACLYCALLNRRLKGLSSLKTGVGASIVSLTNAIKETHQAAKSTQATTVESIETLKDLLAQASAASAKLEAETITLQRKIHEATQLETQLDEKIEGTLPQTIQKAQNTASNLLKVVTDIEKYRVSVASDVSQTIKEQSTQERTKVEADVEAESELESPAEKSIPHLTVVESEPTQQSTESDELEIPEPQGNTKDPIDELFDDIDTLVKRKGVRKRLGFLKSREYYKS
jgi:hypothetical protein